MKRKRRIDQEIDQDQGLTSSNGAVTVLSEDECKRTFKKHKLKVTILEKQSSRDRKRAKMPEKKKRKWVQLWPQPLLSFAELRNRYHISQRLSDNLETQGYREPTEVQMGALPLLLGSDDERRLRDIRSNSRAGAGDSSISLITVAPTGSGKTLAFLVPIIQRLIERKHSTGGRPEHVTLQALVLAPTHELVDQIVNEARKLVVGTGIRVSAIQKGMRVHGDATTEHQQSSAVLDNPKLEASNEQATKTNILIGTPLMTLHALPGSLDSEPLPIPSVRYLVLDEADVLLDALFQEQTLSVWRACNSPDLQTSLWSATIGSSIESLAQTFILDRRRKLKHSDSNIKNTPHHILRLVVGLKDTSIPLINHRLTYAATEQGKLLALRQILHPTAPNGTANKGASDPPVSLQPPFLIFTQTIARAVALHSELLYDIPAEAGGSSRIAVLHSDLSPSRRADIMSGLRKGEIWVVITTDLLSRGVDIRGMNGVVNYDIPTTGASYVHRAGRTGRQGREGGVSVTLYTKDDIPYVKNIANVIAASERAKRCHMRSDQKISAAASRAGLQNPTSKDSGLQEWLLDALPDVSKDTKKMLKRRGIESRRAFHHSQSLNDGKGDGGHGEDAEAAKRARRTRISTKSGYDRRMEGKKRGARQAITNRREDAGSVDDTHEALGGGEDEEWEGFDT